MVVAFSWAPAASHDSYDSGGVVVLVETVVAVTVSVVVGQSPSFHSRFVVMAPEMQVPSAVAVVSALLQPQEPVQSLPHKIVLHGSTMASVVGVASVPGVVPSGWPSTSPAPVEGANDGVEVVSVMDGRGEVLVLEEEAEVEVTVVVVVVPPAHAQHTSLAVNPWFPYLWPSVAHFSAPSHAL